MSETTNTVGDGFTPGWYQVELGNTTMPYAYIRNLTDFHSYINNGYALTPVMILYRSDYDYLTQQNETLAHNNAVLNSTIAELRETLAFAAQYTGFEGRACPLCQYENGKFIEMCQMHKDMDKLRGQVEALRRERDSLFKLNKRNCEDAMRIINGDKSGMELACIAVTEWGKREQYIKELEAELQRRRGDGEGQQS